MSQSGGRSKPVAHGDISRISHPLGAIRKASPMAIVAWGIDSNGEIKRREIRRNAVPSAAARNSTTITTEIRVEENPTHTARSVPRPMPGQSRSAAQGARLTSVAPSAGK